MTDETTIRSKHLHHVAYATRDSEATYDFYANKLGMKLLRTENHRQGEGYFRHFFFDMGAGECLAFFEISNVGEEPGYRTAIAVGNGLPVWVNHLAFALDSLEELELMKKRLRNRGVEQMTVLDHGWSTSLYLVDPNGIMVEFCVTTDAGHFLQTEAEALRLMRLPPDQIAEETRKETSAARRV
ncbi:MAG: VOC family protein [Deltaproteobacteria bacterium]|nr:VOC family protein [Deltaproteobacteria bacterium]